MTNSWDQLATMTGLPRDVIRNIKAFATDKLLPSTTDALIKTLQFKYEDANDNVNYLPPRLEIRSTEAYFIRRDIPSDEPLLTTTRMYIISDFLPSYWSFYANTMDRNING